MRFRITPPALTASKLKSLASRQSSVRPTKMRNKDLSLAISLDSKDLREALMCFLVDDPDRSGFLDMNPVSWPPLTKEILDRAIHYWLEERVEFGRETVTSQSHRNLNAKDKENLTVWMDKYIS